MLDYSRVIFAGRFSYIMDIFLSSIFIYPVKSLPGIAVNSAKLTESGLRYDRRFMLIDETGAFMTQRRFPKLALLSVSESAGGFVVAHYANGMKNEIEIPFECKPQKTLLTHVWDDECEVSVCDQKFGDFFSEFLGINCRLVYQHEPVRKIGRAGSGSFLSLADASPVLLIGSASLRDLNSRLDVPVGMNRFRPNLVIETDKPFAEDEWQEFFLGDQRFVKEKSCGRCVMITVDPDLGVMGKEPLSTLAGYRKKDNNVYFGVYFRPVGPLHSISIGDSFCRIRSSPDL